MVNTAVTALIYIPLILVSLYSIAENEEQTTGHFFLGIILLPAPFLLIHTLTGSRPIITGLGMIRLIPLILIDCMLPTSRLKSLSTHQPAPLPDQRDTIFAQNDLIMEATNYEDFYRYQPDRKFSFDAFCFLPGLFSLPTGQYHLPVFGTARGSFSVAAALKPLIDGPFVYDSLPFSSETMTLLVKKGAEKSDAIDAGINSMLKFHLYRFRDRNETGISDAHNDYFFGKLLLPIGRSLKHKYFTMTNQSY